MDFRETEETKARIAKNAAALIDRLAGGRTFVVNLGVGIPTRIASYLTNENVYVEAENGILGVGPAPKKGEGDWQLIDAGRRIVTETPGCCYFSSADSFGMMRGGHIDATVLGAFSVDGEANISNWIIPGGNELGVGGAMDLVCGAKRVIVTMAHCRENGEKKLVRRSVLPVTGYHEADYIVTQFCMMRYTGSGYEVFALAKGVTPQMLRDITGFDFTVADGCGRMLD